VLHSGLSKGDILFFVAAAVAVAHSENFLHRLQKMTTRQQK
jgi:hypothetical protein